MFELLVIAIGVLAVVGVGLVVRSRQGEGDPSSSVHAFNRALSAMEPGSGGRRRSAAGDGADGEPTPDDADGEPMPDGADGEPASEGDADRRAPRDGDEVAGNPPRS